MRAKILCVLVVAVLGLMAGCESESLYVPLGGSSLPVGYTQTRISDDVYDVTYKGNGGMDYGYARHMAILRAAEIGRELRYTHFTIEGEQDATEMKEFSYSLPTRRTSYVGGVLPTPVTTYGQQEFSETVRFPRPTLRIRYYEGPPEGRHLRVHEVSRAIQDLCTAYGITLPAGQP